MDDLPTYKIQAYWEGDKLPAEAQELFKQELEETIPPDRPDYDKWDFVLCCAVAESNNILGGIYADVGPINFGPVADDKMAILENLFVWEEYRRKGIGTNLMQKLIQELREEGCHYIRCNASWDNPGEIALYKKCGFALVDINEPGEGGEYFVVKSLQD